MLVQEGRQGLSAQQFRAGVLVVAATQRLAHRVAWVAKKLGLRRSRQLPADVDMARMCYPRLPQLADLEPVGSKLRFKAALVVGVRVLYKPIFHAE